MNYRLALIEDSISLTTAGSRTVDIDFVDVCSRFQFDIRYKNPASGADTYLDHPMSAIEKIELVDGSDVLESISGKQLGAMMFYDNKGYMFNINDAEMATSNGFTLNLDFGRYLWDRELAFDPGKFTNPQLKLTYDKANIHASEQTLTYSLYGHLFDERKVSPMGFLMRKEVEKWTPTADAHHYVTMPTDYKYRTMWLHGQGTNSGGDNRRGIPSAIANFKLSEDQDKRVPIDMSTKEYLRLLDAQFPLVRERVNCYPDATGTTRFIVMPSQEMRAIVTGSGDYNHYVNITEGSTLGLGTSGGGASKVFGEAIGQCAHHIMPIVFGDQQDPADWYNVRKDMKLKLDCQTKNETQYNAEATVLLTQLRPY